MIEVFIFIGGFGCGMLASALICWYALKLIFADHNDTFEGI